MSSGLPSEGGPVPQLGATSRPLLDHLRVVVGGKRTSSPSPPSGVGSQRDEIREPGVRRKFELRDFRAGNGSRSHASSPSPGRKLLAPPPRSAKAMKLLTKISSIRRTAWTHADRARPPHSRCDPTRLASQCRCRVHAFRPTASAGAVSGCCASQCILKVEPGCLRSSSAMARSRRAWPSRWSKEM